MKTYGHCTHCGSVEIELVQVDGWRDLDGHEEYPYGYGCELCS